MSKSAIRRILVPTDFSASSRAALEYAVALAHAFDAEVSVLHVVEVEREEREQKPDAKRLRATGRTDEWRYAERDVQAAVERLRSKGLTTHQRLVEGEPLSQIVKVAGEEKADLIVMGAHGREGSPRTWLGCTIERVMRRAPCPVVAVREDQRPAISADTGGGRESGPEVIVEQFDLPTKP
jgi:nucleotide-binding universal stress UspA family protein